MPRPSEDREAGHQMTKPIYTTNCFNTFIRVAEDCPAHTGEDPPPRAGKPTVANLQYAMIATEPYKYTSDDVIFATSAAGRELGAKATKQERTLARKAFFSKGQACMRASGLGKRFGWGVHADSEGRIAIYAIDSKRYQALARDLKLTQVRAMRSKRA
ncbi:hypothetical protein ABID59_003453 [Bradyrhizobium sp. S3.3.6]